ncbi:transcription initiation factor TFIID subunit 8 [Leptonychotes weddellii]|uniref:Transcription initiation factor TFIID subunit 8 n=1 Tax=Leptonychotes weddellii TaxID=9713 RepID=A0A7F8QGX6_LEPWE|nr:transcription initiation factor TFIID subunit 8 [Leptonychotes weddellii]
MTRDPHPGLVRQDDSGAEKENTSVLQQNPSLSGSRNGEENVIDNPYLRPVKKPKIRRKKAWIFSPTKWNWEYYKVNTFQRIVTNKQRTSELSKPSRGVSGDPWWHSSSDGSTMG